MVALKHIEGQSATVAFCPVAGLLATGTMAGALDASFDTASRLDIYYVDLSSGDEQLRLAGSVQAPERFNRLVWGAAPAPAAGGGAPNPLPYGLLAGGLADGSVCLWDPAALLNSDGNSSPTSSTTKRNPLLARMNKHAGSVKGLAFNPFSPNLLASGGADGELCVWDVSNPTAPSLYPPLRAPQAGGQGGGAGGGPGGAGGPGGGGQGGGAGPGGGGGGGNPQSSSSAGSGHDVTSLAWNRKVQHIVATTHGDGSTVVWDLKKQRPVITLRDAASGASRRASAVAWSPEVATQLVVASDDDRSPTLQAWDLRSAAQPLREYVGHVRGVLALDWCPQDPALLLSCGRDGRAICWDAGSGDAVCELAAGASPASAAVPGGAAASAGGAPLQDVRWSPRSPGMFAVAGGNGRVALHSLEACTGGGLVETINPDFSVTAAPSGEPPRPLRRAPCWMGRPSSVAWGFGGTLVSVSNRKSSGVDPQTAQARTYEIGSVAMRQVVAEPGLAARGEAFEQALCGGATGADGSAGGGYGAAAAPAGSVATDRAALRAFCAAKADDALARAGQEQQQGGGEGGDASASSAARAEAETWAFVGVLFEDDARRQLLAQLGFADALAAAQAAAARQQAADEQQQQQQQGNGADAALAAAAQEHLALGGGAGAAAAAASAGGAPPPLQQQEDDGDFFNRETAGGAGDGAGFFDRLQTNGGQQGGGPDGQQQQQPPAAGTTTPPGTPGGATTGGGAGDASADLLDQVGAEAEEEVQRAIFVADYSAAVDACFRAKRPADALLLANLGGADLWRRAMARHMRRSPRPYMGVVRALVDGDFASLVKTRPVAQWRDTLAVLATYAGPDQWPGLCEALASRLAAAGNAHAACLCHVVALNVDGAVAHWAKGLQQQAKGVAGGAVGPPDPAVLQGVVEKAVVMGLAAAAAQGGGGAGAVPSNASSSAALGDVVAAYAGELAAQGRMQAAMRLLELAPLGAAAEGASASVAELRDRVYRSGAAAAAGVVTSAPPPFPFVQEEVTPYVVPPLQPAVSQQQPQAQQQAYQQQQQQQQPYGAAAAAAAAAPYQQQQPQPPAANPYGGYGQQQPQQQQQPYGGYGQPPQQQHQPPANPYAAAPAPPPPQQPAPPASAAYGAYGQQQQHQQPPTPGSARPLNPYAPQQQQQQQPYGAYGGGGGAYGAPPPPQQQQAAPAPPPPVAAFVPTTAAAPPPPAQQQSYQQQQQQQPYQPQMQPLGSGALGGPHQPYAPQHQQAPQAPPPQAAPTFFTPAAAAGPGAGGPPPSSGVPPPYGGAPMMPGQQHQQQPMGMMQQAAQQAAAPPPPSGPPAHITLQTADVSRVPADQKPIVAQLHALYNACAPLANNPARKREMDDNSKRLGQLLWRLNEGQVSPHVVARLLALCSALARGDWQGAAAVQVELTATDWDECGTWLTAVKRLVKVRQMVG